MARKRMIDPAIWTDRKTLRLKLEAFIVWVGLISHADDEGIIEADPYSLYHKLARPELTPEVIVAQLEVLAAAELVVTYGDYVFLPNFFKHQTLNRPSRTKLRRPPRDQVQRFPLYLQGWEAAFGRKDAAAKYPYDTCYIENPDYSGDTHGTLSEDSVSDSGGLTPNGIEGNRIEGKGREEKGGCTPPDPPAQALQEPSNGSTHAESPNVELANHWARRYFEHTARPFVPQSKEFSKAVEVLRTLGGDLSLGLKAIDGYFDDDWWFTRDKRTRKPSYSFGGFAAHVTELLAPARASPAVDPADPTFGVGRQVF